MSNISTKFQKLGYKIASNGTDNHLILVDLSNKNINGARAEYVLELLNIATNKNTIPGDTNAMNPSGIRIGTPAMTTRGMIEQDFIKIANYVDQGINIAIKIQSYTTSKTTKELLKQLLMILKILIKIYLINYKH